MADRPRSLSGLRRRCHQLLDVGLAGDRLCQQLHWLLIALVVINVGAVILESVPSIEARYRPVFAVIEWVSVVIFTLEYGIRLWVAVEHTTLAGQSPLRARLAYALSPGMLIDLLAILPFYISLVWPVDLRVLLVLRLLRFFKIARYSTGMRSLADAIYAERGALAACGGILCGIMVMSAAFMHLAEHTAQPDKFGTIPDAMYWAVVTLTTVGYGDIVPVTPVGKIVAGLTAITGLGMLALPVGILATAFSEVIHRRDFVVTWGMVARVPLFSTFDVDTIGEILRFLQSQSVGAGELVVRKGEKATAMFIVAAGRVDVILPDKTISLGPGDFFGEIALVESTRRTADVRAAERTSLLVLEAGDMHQLMERRPDVAEHVRRVAKARLGQVRAAMDNTPGRASPG